MSSENEVEQAPIIPLVERILRSAVNCKAKVINILPTFGPTEVFYSDASVGELDPDLGLPRNLHEPILLRLRQMANITSQIGEPGEGTLELECEGVNRRFQVQTKWGDFGDSARIEVCPA